MHQRLGRLGSHGVKHINPRQRICSILKHGRRSRHPMRCMIGASSQPPPDDDEVPYSTLHEDEEQFVVTGVVSGVVSTIEPNQAEVGSILG